MMHQVSSLYIHVPFCKHLCNYCDFFKKSFDAPAKQITDFNDYLSESFKVHDELMNSHHVSWRNLETLYLGGGTPSLWGVDGAFFLKENLLSKISIENNAEFTMEIDPGTWDEDLIEEWKKIGMNRISIGTQSLNPDFLKILDRSHGLDESLTLLNYCSKNNWNFSLDFLLGVPFSKEKKRDILHELELLLSFKPKHVSLYILNARSKYPHVAHIPDDEYIREEYLLVSDFLKTKGFHHYEVSNFALPGFESRHNQKYWQNASVAALGPTGTGLFSFSPKNALRYKWKVSKAHYELEKLTEKEILLESTYLGLRTSAGWKPPHFSEEIRSIFQMWSMKNFGKWDGERFYLNSEGYLMLDSLMDDLFRLGIV